MSFKTKLDIWHLTSIQKNILCIHNVCILYIYMLYHIVFNCSIVYSYLKHIMENMLMSFNLKTCDWPNALAFPFLL